METLVATAVFSVTMLVATNVFVVVAKSQRRASNVQKTQGDVRFAVEAIAREVRFGTVDYAYYSAHPADITALNGNLAGQTSILALLDAQSNRVRFQVLPDAAGDNKLQICFLNILTNPLTYCDAPPTNWQVITPEGVKVVGATFFISPLRNPFAVCNPAQTNNSAPDFCTNAPSPYLDDAQPRATFVLRTQQLGEENSPERVSMQTTVTSRMYPR